MEVSANTHIQNTTECEALSWDSILTLGIYYCYWQYKRWTLNAWLGREEYNFWLWLVLYILTCSIFELYYEYKMAKGINEIQENNSLASTG